ncbi:MAG: nitroreductase family deazaflavin-dependent oxidoreductase [Chloroflexi bacterium]|nr:MAG: nitroreductase family deazaflavin-dependent oxidoreductase [Chloroflexota bacterium]TME48717.1 MAG: nitroreductase family deazaflavin-dependent oxidoreductase [Chloroflexota bacterium]
MANWNDATIKEFHSKEGKGVGPFGDRLMLLTTVGARSREERISPLMYHRDGERYIVVASKGGAPDNPAWYLNLKANPVAKVEVGAKSGTDTFQVRATEAQGEERDRLFAERVAIAPGFGEYQRNTSRKIPVMILERTG